MVSVNIDIWSAAIAGLVNGLVTLAGLVAYDRYVKSQMNKAFEKMEKHIVKIVKEVKE